MNCSWFLQISSLRYWVWWTWFLVYFKLEFYRLKQTENPVQTGKKKSVLQTGYFKLENSKNQVQIDRGKKFGGQLSQNLKIFLGLAWSSRYWWLTDTLPNFQTFQSLRYLSKVMKSKSSNLRKFSTKQTGDDKSIFL